MERIGKCLTGQRFTLTKNQRLRRKKWVKALFNKGKTYCRHPIKIHYLAHAEASEHQVLVAIPKKNVPKATHRNKIRRQIRNAHRLQQHILSTTSPKLLIAYVYIDRSYHPAYSLIQATVAYGLAHLQSIHEEVPIVCA
ncbi:MAG: ribonuclease P protein component [Cytophagales bacterium]